jgi:hypothetical protein
LRWLIPVFACPLLPLPLQVTGILEHSEYLTKWQQHPDVLYARPLVQVREQEGVLAWPSYD